MQHPKESDFSSWYTELLQRAELLDYHEISGCYVIRPTAFVVWEAIQDYLNGELRRNGVKSCYFPLFISQATLEQEKDHLEGFSPEVAWVTKYGTSDLNQPIAIRPTSETAMYPYFAKWIQSHRDLPLQLHQWCNVVRCNILPLAKWAQFHKR